MEEECYLIDARSRSSSPNPPPCDDYLREFIKTYEMTPSLWDKTNRSYTDKHKRNRDLDKLASILSHIKPNATRDDARKKINSLRSNFRKDMMKVEMSKRRATRPDEVFRPGSATFHMLKFLAKSEDYILSQGDSDDEDKVEKATLFSTPNEDPLFQPSKNTKKAKSAKRMKLNTPSPKSTPHHHQSTPQTNIISSPQSNVIRTTPQSNIILPPKVPAVEPIVLVWSEKIKKLTPAQKLHAEKAINDMLYEAELQNLSELSQGVSSPVMVSYYSQNSDKIESDLGVEKEESFDNED